MHSALCAATRRHRLKKDLFSSVHMRTLCRRFSKALLWKPFSKRCGLDHWKRRTRVERPKRIEIAAFSKRSSHAWTRLFILTTKTTKIGYCDVNRSMCSSITSISNSILSPSQSSKGYLRLYKVFFLYSLTNSSNSLINN